MTRNTNGTTNAQYKIDKIAIYGKTISSKHEDNEEIEIFVYKLNNGKYLVKDSNDITHTKCYAEDVTYQLFSAIEKIFDDEDILSVSFIQSDNDVLPSKFSWDLVFDKINDFKERYNN